jgi:hypothetical protein
LLFVIIIIIIIIIIMFVCTWCVSTQWPITTAAAAAKTTITTITQVIHEVESSLKSLYLRRFSRHYSCPHFWNTKFHYRIHNSLPQFHVLKDTNPVPTLPRYLFIFNIIQLSSKERSFASHSFNSTNPHAFLKEAASFIRNIGR